MEMLAAPAVYATVPRSPRSSLSALRLPAYLQVPKLPSRSQGNRPHSRFCNVALPACGARATLAPVAIPPLVSAFPVVLRTMVDAARAFLQNLAAAVSRSNSATMLYTTGPLFFATMTPVTTPLTVVASGMAKWLELYSAVMLVRVLLSWFPNIPWERQPFMAIRDMCDPYLNLFRNIIPPVFNALDLSPMLAFMVLGTLATILNSAARG